ncbi:MAG: hypothetical protein KGH75_08820 [Rhodospirillales bacterium]|nr:hypothetical protein [Rhodospirillales bacterium]
MSDRALIEMAAKAAGLTLHEHFDVHGEYWPWCVELGYNWNPLTDDGDALRLAVRVDLEVWQGGNMSKCSHDSFLGNIIKEPHTGDVYASTRRAIVRAAAEIAKSSATGPASDFTSAEGDAP